MQEFKGTPGPWEWREDSYAGSVYNEHGFLLSGNVIQVNEDREDGESWLDMRRRTDGDREAARLESEANTRLIAAAPELLKALQEVVAISDRKHEAWDKAHAAIAKALGQTQQQR